MVRLASQIHGPSAILILLVAGTVVAAPPRLQAQPSDYFQGKTLTIFVDTPVGGGYDLNARVLARHLADHIPGHPEIIVSNMPGAHGIRGANYVYSVAAKDGTAIGAEIENLAQYQGQGIEGVAYDATKFGWIGSIAPSNEVFYVWHTVPVHTLSDLKTRETILASTGPTETYARLLEEFAGARFKVISGYDGIKAANLALERGEVEAAMSSLPVLRAYWPQWLADKKIRIFFYQGMVRSPDLPDVPASIELAKTDADRAVIGFFAKSSSIGRAYVVPPGVSPQVLGILRAAFDATMKDDGFLSDCKRSNIEVNPKAGGDLQKLVGEIVDVDAHTRAEVRKIAGDQL
jgi:tripartite-type tricarboxylate transporter receptor subunit TctC